MAFSLSNKENYFLALQHKPTEYTPISMTDSRMVGVQALFIERGDMSSHQDVFGVRWEYPDSALGGAIPAPGEFLLEDVTKWKQVIKFPDLSAYDFEGMAEAELAGVDRDTTFLELALFNHTYERLATFMGFENALISMATEPEATYELLSAITDYRIDLLRRMAKSYRPDSVIYLDDIATERSLFMSPGMYREMIKPQHKRFNDVALELGIIPIQHTCGKAEAVVPDLIDIGAAAWNSVQPTNDIAGIIETYGDRLTVYGGYDTNGAPGQLSATEEQVREEVRRCFSEYAGYGKGFIFNGFIVTRVQSSDQGSGFKSQDGLACIIVDEAIKQRELQK